MSRDLLKAGDVRPQPKILLAELVDRAMRGIEGEPVEVRARIYEAAALVLDGAAADAASAAAHHLRHAMEAQMTFHALVQRR